MRFRAEIGMFAGRPAVLVRDDKLGVQVDYWLGRPTPYKLWRARRYAKRLNRAVKADA